MTEHLARIEWNRGGAVFTDGRYSRGHTWRFDGGIEVPASASPHIVRPPMSAPDAVDPEEAFVASLASCHMLWFLSIAAGRGFVVDEYRDDAAGVLGMDTEGNEWIERVTLRPDVRFGGSRAPSHDEKALMHHEAHERCFIARSVRTEVLCEPQ